MSFYLNWNPSISSSQTARQLDFPRSWFCGRGSEQYFRRPHVQGIYRLKSAHTSGLLSLLTVAWSPQKQTAALDGERASGTFEAHIITPQTSCHFKGERTCATKYCKCWTHRLVVHDVHWGFREAQKEKQQEKRCVFDIQDDGQWNLRRSSIITIGFWKVSTFHQLRARRDVSVVKHSHLDQVPFSLEQWIGQASEVSCHR